MTKLGTILSIIAYVWFVNTDLQAQGIYKIEEPFDTKKSPSQPNYGDLYYWAAHPDKKDLADTVPHLSNQINNQQRAKADVFFLYPTIYLQKPTNQYTWNADTKDEKLNKQIDESTILNQATAFNGSCRLFAPRYRQAHYYVFLTKNKKDKEQALDLAYQDVKAAFEYYLEHYNNGRPIVIAGHSQGTIHAGRLLKDFFDGKPLQKQLVEAYLIGIATPADYFINILPSDSPETTGGFVTWNTFAKGYTPDYYADGLDKAVCTNPLTWRTNDEYAPRELNKGGVGLKFTFVDKPVDAQVHNGMLWVCKPYIKGRAFIRIKIWHRADINLFWMNIRENVALRIENFLATQINGE